MAARLVGVLLLALIALLQYGLWLGKGSWLRVWEIDRSIAEQRQTNDALAARNAALDAEVRDLKEGLGAIEERARNELGMIRRDEVFFQVLEPGSGKPAAPAH
jgi:cell division protein FtsB